VVIPKGQRFITFNLTVPSADAAVFSPLITYGVGVSITSVSNNVKIAGNLKNLVFAINIKNAYDGVYQVVSGLVTRYTAPGVPAGDALSGNLAGNPDVLFITSGATTVSIPPSGSTGGLFWAFGNNSMVAGIDGLSVTVNPGTNAVTMASTGNGTLANWAGHINSYDPATKTFHLSFKWNPTANVREYEVILKYRGPR
jgi:hypothetical protein